jgi:ATP adenylyltransferase
MEILWSPWRSKYIETFKDEDKNKSNSCFLCDAALTKGKDKELLVVHRNKLCFVILNKYPYNNGHSLIAPYRHVATLNELTDDELFELFNTTRITVTALQEIYNPNGYNIGINIGRVAGAGLPGHIHVHVVPRWNGDTSFTAVISDVKVVSQSLEDTQKILSKTFLKIIESQ